MYRSLLVVIALSTVTGCAFLQPDAKPTAPAAKTAKVDHPGKAAVALFDAPAAAPAAAEKPAEKAEKPAVVASNDHPAAKAEGSSKSRLMMPVKLDNPPKEQLRGGGAKAKGRR